METNKKQENTSDLQDIANTTTNLASSTPNVATNLPAVKPSSEVSLAKEFTNGILKALSNPKVSREGTFEEVVDKACR